MQTEKVLRIISHTDLDGVVSAALAWHAGRSSGLPIKVSLMGYGEVDNAILESLDSGQRLVVLDLFCQRDRTVVPLTDFSRGGALPLYSTITKALLTGTATENGL